MRTLGLIGGMSWESTAHYYARLNELVAERLGGLHSARLLLWNADFDEIAALQQADDWDGAGAILAAVAQRLESAGADALLICANTMHRVAPAIEAAVNIPLLHLADITADALRRDGFRRAALLGTRFTMAQPFYRERLESHGLAIDVPNADEQEDIHRIIYEELVKGRFEPRSRTLPRDHETNACDRIAGRHPRLHRVRSLDPPRRCARNTAVRHHRTSLPRRRELDARLTNEK